MVFKIIFEDRYAREDTLSFSACCIEKAKEQYYHWWKGYGKDAKYAESKIISVKGEVIKLREHQKTLVKSMIKKLNKYGIVYNTSDARIGKTISALHTAKKLKCESVLFVTTKTAIPDVYKDYEAMDYKFKLQVINYASVHKVHGNYDMIILDEVTAISSYKPKMNLTQNKIFALMEIAQPRYKVLMSATPNVESGSQLYYPLRLVGFWDGLNFMQWFNKYGEPSSIRISGGRSVASYKKTNEAKIMKEVKKLMVSVTREDAGFEQHTTSYNLIEIKPNKVTTTAYEAMIKDSLLEVGDIMVLGDTSASKAQKCQQITSGFIYDELGNALPLAGEKQMWCLGHIDKKKKTVIYCQFRYEVDMFKFLYKDILLEYKDFADAKSGVFVSQQRSGAFGLDLHTADKHIFTSLGWSGELFIQSTERLHNAKRKDDVVVDILHLGLIDKDIAERVIAKKDYQAKMLK